MTGPEHYKEAERLLSDAEENHAHQGSGDPATPDLLATAQVHATLALAAATALAPAHKSVNHPDTVGWTKVAGGAA